MYLSIEENPNCPTLDGMRFKPLGPARPISHVFLDRHGRSGWRAVAGIGPSFSPHPAHAVKVGDSGEGDAYLVFGGDWGLRFQDEDAGRPWSPEDAAQWSEPYLLLSAAGANLRFR